MTAKQIEARLAALLTMPEMTTKVLWDRVVERGRGLNFRIHGEHDRYRDPMTVAKALTSQMALPLY
jgi:hypothetical protein